MLLLIQVMRRVLPLFLAIFPAPERLNATGRQSTSTGDLDWVLQLIQGLDSGFDYVQYVSTSQALGENVANAGCFDHCTHSATSNYACAWGGRFQEDFSRTEPRSHLMGDGGPSQRDKAHIASCLLSAFADGIWHFTGFTYPNTDTAAVISYHYDCPEAEAAPTFYYLGCACDMHHTLVKLFDLFEFWFPIRHIPSEKAYGRWQMNGKQIVAIKCWLTNYRLSLSTIS